MVSRLAIYHPPGRIGVGANAFGKDVANTQLYRALALHGGFEQLDILNPTRLDAAILARDLLQDRPCPTRIGTADLFGQAPAAQAGALLRGQPYLDALAWLRRGSVGDRAYSLIGLVHTLAPPSVREGIARVATAPIQPWDAVICTSPAVQDALEAMLGEWCDHLRQRFGGDRRPTLRLPLIPLGVDQPAIQALADRPAVRSRVRTDLRMKDDEILLLWVGRLSFFEKAFPQPMFKAVEMAAQATDAKVRFVLAGWFPNAELHRPLYEEAAQAYAPSVRVQFVDGNDQEILGGLWAAADVFLSLVDNIQETFGITPLEAMAAGLPVVASDWDGYRYTVRDGIEGFLIPTLGGPTGGAGQPLIDRHTLQVDSYQAYAGATAQFTAVHIGRAADALAALIGSAELRGRMGAAGRARVKSAFDWPVVVELYRQLLDELAEVRAHAEGDDGGAGRDPVWRDPFNAFAGFATEILHPQTRLAVAPGVDARDLERAGRLKLDGFAALVRARPDECARLLALVGAGQATTLAAALEHFPPDRGAHVQLAASWMCKLGLLDWL